MKHFACCCCGCSACSLNILCLGRSFWDLFVCCCSFYDFCDFDFVRFGCELKKEPKSNVVKWHTSDFRHNPIDFRCIPLEWLTALRHCFALHLNIFFLMQIYFKINCGGNKFLSAGGLNSKWYLLFIWYCHMITFQFQSINICISGEKLVKYRKPINSHILFRYSLICSDQC